MRYILSVFLCLSLVYSPGQPLSSERGLQLSKLLNKGLVSHYLIIFYVHNFFGLQDVLVEKSPPRDPNEQMEQIRNEEKEKWAKLMQKQRKILEEEKRLLKVETQLSVQKLNETKNAHLHKILEMKEEHEHQLKDAMKEKEKMGVVLKEKEQFCHCLEGERDNACIKIKALQNTLLEQRETLQKMKLEKIMLRLKYTEMHADIVKLRKDFTRHFNRQSTSMDGRRYSSLAANLWPSTSTGILSK